MDILKIIFVIFLLILPLGEVFRFDLGNSLFVKPADFIAVILILILFVKGIRHSGNQAKPEHPESRNWFGDSRQARMTGSILLFVVVALVSLFVNIKHLSNSELIVSFFYLARWVLYALLYYLVKSFSSEFKKKILFMLFASGTLFVLFGFIQYFFYSNLRNLYYLGWDDHMHRLFSTFLDPNFTGAFLVLYFVFLSGMYLYFLKNKGKKIVILSMVVLLLTLLAIYLTFSRSALIMLFASFITFSILTKKAKWMLGLALISLMFIAISSKNFYIENINLFRIASSEARIDSAKNAIQIIKDNPILGVGFNGYRYAQIRYGFRHGENAMISHADAGTDNSFLFILATTGFVGLFGYLYLLFSILSRAYLNYKLSKNTEIKYYISIITIASFVGIIIDSLFINSLFYSFNMIWLWIVVGLIKDRDSSR